LAKVKCTLTYIVCFIGKIAQELTLLYFRKSWVHAQAFCFGPLVFRMSTELHLLYIQWHCRSDRMSSLWFRIREKSQWWTVLWQVFRFWWTDQYHWVRKVGVRTSKLRFMYVCKSRWYTRVGL